MMLRLLGLLLVSLGSFSAFGAESFDVYGCERDQQHVLNKFTLTGDSIARVVYSSGLAPVKYSASVEKLAIYLPGDTYFSGILLGKLIRSLNVAHGNADGVLMTDKNIEGYYVVTPSLEKLDEFVVIAQYVRGSKRDVAVYVSALEGSASPILLKGYCSPSALTNIPK